MTVKERRVIVIGAGPAGMTSAYRLQSEGFSVTLLESSESVGGMARTFDLWGNKVDIGPHRFFSHDTRVNRFWLEAVRGEYVMVNRLTRIFYKGKFFNYPLQASNALLNLGILESLKCVYSFCKRQIFKKSNENRFDSWVINRFGDRLFKIFFKSYTEKLWGLEVSKIDSEFATQRIRKLSLYEAIKSALFKKTGNQHRTLVDEFAYPVGGAGVPYENLKSRFLELGGVIEFKAKVSKIRKTHESFYVETKNGLNFQCDELISTMPITSLVNALSAPEEVISTASKLRFRNTIVVYLLIEGLNPFPDQWIYIHSPELQTGRITNFSNWKTGAEKSTKHVVCLEYWCNSDEELWVREDSFLIKNATSEFLKSGLSEGTNTIDGFVVRVPRCYPIYEMGYQEKLDKLKNYLNSIKNLYPIGRYGSFKYNNQDHSILMGLLAAENISRAMKNDLWSVNSDTEYQEKSKITSTGLVHA